MQTSDDYPAKYTNNHASGGDNQYGDKIYNGNVYYAGRPAGQDSNQCLRDLCVTDPREDRTRIQDEKDRLLRDCYAWILDDASFQRWRTQDESRLLWIRGDPGKGKTMMTMGVIAELSSRAEAEQSSLSGSWVLPDLEFDSEPCLVTYFFCQSTRPELNNAVSVLRGLIYLLVVQQDQLMRHVQRRYEAVGSKLFEGPNAIHALREILSDILIDPTLPMTYLLVDALDECTTGVSTLLRVITDDSLARRSRIKWLVTSRNLPEIEQYLQPDAAGIKVSLEVSADQVLRAVAAFINLKVQDLATVKKYGEELQAEVEKVLRGKAEGTFLWVSLVCKELEGVEYSRTRKVLQDMPPGLDPLYKRMMGQISAQHVETAKFCEAVLRAVNFAFRPLRLRELVVVAGLPSNEFDDPQAVADLVSRCGSFLTIREETASFIHLSAKDYFMAGNARRVFDGATVEEHRRVTYRLLNAMRRSLRRDMCGLERSIAQSPGSTRQIKDSILTQIAYACEYWVEHLCASNFASPATSEDILQDGDAVDLFLQKKFLY
jgi:hypothetical protein